jgi:hypothetical protein
MNAITKTSLVLFVSIMLFGCIGPKQINIDNVGQKQGILLNSSVGEVFFEREVMTGEDNGYGFVFKGDAQRIELVVRSASKDKLVLDYSEYMKPLESRYGGYKKDGAWLKKPAFDKLLEFNLNESKIVFFNKFEFEIIEVKGGRITYKRIK